MTLLDKKLISIVQDLDLGEINETKKLALLDEISEIITERIILRLIKEVPKDKKDLFIQKINDHKNEPDKMLLFIDYFVDDADKFIDEELDNYKNDLQKAIETT